MVEIHSMETAMVEIYSMEMAMAEIYSLETVHSTLNLWRGS